MYKSDDGTFIAIIIDFKWAYFIYDVYTQSAITFILNIAITVKFSQKVLPMAASFDVRNFNCKKKRYSHKEL